MVKSKRTNLMDFDGVISTPKDGIPFAGHLIMPIDTFYQEFLRGTLLFVDVNNDAAMDVFRDYF